MAVLKKSFVNHGSERMSEILEIVINPEHYYNANGLKLKGSELLHKLANGLRYEVIQKELEKEEVYTHEE